MKITPVALVGLTGASAVLASQSPVSARVLPEIPVSQASRYPCYIITAERRAFDLSSMCAISRPETIRSNLDRSGKLVGNRALINQQNRKVRSQNPSSRRHLANSYPSRWSYLPERSGDVIGGYSENNRYASGGVGSTGSTASGGNCDTPDQIAADGKRCGDRAASRKPGGR